MNIEELEVKLKSRDIAALSRAITLNESTRIEDNILVDNIIAHNTSALDQSMVIAISGIPGVGKSSFIDVFGSYLHSIGKSVAVFSVDPSSEISHGSILGDKTRMQRLAALDHVFIRPSPSSNRLGGIGINTHKNIELAKIAGYDIILIETVGVGQSETLVRKLCDIFILLSMPASGDELQGIKKGIMEIADFFIINKTDGDLALSAEKTRKEIISAIDMTRNEDIASRVICFSSLFSDNIDIIWDRLSQHETQSKKENKFIPLRKEQRAYWINETFEKMLYLHCLQKHSETISLINTQAKEGNYICLEEILRLIKDVE